MDLIDLIIGLGAFVASIVLIALLLVQGSALLASLLVAEEGPEPDSADVGTLLNG